MHFVWVLEDFAVSEVFPGPILVTSHCARETESQLQN